MYGVPLPIMYYSMSEEPHNQMQDNTPMKKNVCYAASAQHMEIVSNDHERYASIKNIL